MELGIPTILDRMSAEKSFPFLLAISFGKTPPESRALAPFRNLPNFAGKHVHWSD